MEENMAVDPFETCSLFSCYGWCMEGKKTSDVSASGTCSCLAVGFVSDVASMSYIYMCL